MGHGCAGAEGGGYKGGLGEFQFRGAGFFGTLGVDLDAVWALGGERDSDGHEFFVIARNGTGF